MSGADPPVKAEEIHVSVGNSVASDVETVVHVPQAIPNSSHSNEGAEGSEALEELTSILSNTDDKTPLLTSGLNAGIQPTLASLEVPYDLAPAISSSPPIHELGKGPKSENNAGMERLGSRNDECLPVTFVPFEDDFVAQKSAGEKTAKRVKPEQPASPLAQQASTKLSPPAKSHHLNQDQAFTNLEMLQHSRVMQTAVNADAGLSVLTPNFGSNVPAQSSPDDCVKDEEEKEDIVLIPEAYLVEENAPDDVSFADNFVTGTLLEMDPHHAPCAQKSTKLLIAAVCLSVIVITTALVISLSSSGTDDASTREKLLYKIKNESAFPSLSPSSAPSVSKYPSLSPTMTSAPTMQKNALFKVDCDYTCWPVVAIHGTTAVITRDKKDIQFFSFANTSKSFIPHEPVTEIEIDYVAITAAVDGNTAVVGFKKSENDDVGAAYVYEKDESGIWYEAALLEPRDFNQGSVGEAYYISSGSLFGTSVAIEGDLILVGADDDGDIGEGSLYIFRRNQTSWFEEAKLVAPRLTEGYGYSVSVKGNVAVVSDVAYGTHDEGAVFIYEYNSLSNFWNLSENTLLNDSCSAKFGHFVTLTYDGALLVVCAGDNTIYYYEKQVGSSGANEYTLKQIISFDNALSSINVDGDIMVASESREHISELIHFYIRRNHVWEWMKVIDEPTFDEYFGWDVAVSGNVTLIASEKNVYIV